MSKWALQKREERGALFPDGERRLRFRRRVKVFCDDEAGDTAQYDDEGEREEDLVPDVCVWSGMAESSEMVGEDDEEEENGELTWVEGEVGPWTSIHLVRCTATRHPCARQLTVRGQRRSAAIRQSESSRDRPN